MGASDLDILHRLGADEIGRQRIAEQVRYGHLRVAVLHRAADIPRGIARQNAHQDRASRLASPRPTHEQAFAARREGQQRKQDVGRIALCRRQRQLGATVAHRESRRWGRVVFDVVMRADDRVVDDPEIGLPQLFIERSRLRFGYRPGLDRAIEQLRDVIAFSRPTHLRVRRGLRQRRK